MTNFVPKQIKSLIKTIIKSNCFSNENLFHLVSSLNITPADLKPFELFNHALNESYGRYVLYNSPELEVVVMSWNKGDYTSIHDHGAAQWGAVLCFGQLEHTSFGLQNENLFISKKECFQSEGISMVSNQLIHQMGNPFDKPAMTLHIYGTDACVKEVTGNARNYDPFKEMVVYANGGAYLEIPEQQIVKEKQGPNFQSEIYYNSVKILLDYKLKQQKTAYRKQLRNNGRKNIVEYI